MKLVHRVLVALAPSVGGAWVRGRRRRYRRRGRSLRPDERAAFAGYFDAALLDRVRVAVVERIEAPVLNGLAEALGAGPTLSLASVRAMAFGDSVGVAGNEPALSLLFHELVHVVQYELFGIGPMLRRYVKEWAASDGDVLAISAERCAYELQEEFERRPDRPFNVRNEVARRMTDHTGRTEHE